MKMRIRSSCLVGTLLASAAAMILTPRDPATRNGGEARDGRGSMAVSAVDGRRPLEDLVREARVALAAGLSVQLRATWTGIQTESVPTVVLGTFGHRLDMAKYTGLRVRGRHYGNDSPDTVRYYQLPASAWTTLLDAIDTPVTRELFDAGDDAAEETIGRQWTLCIGARVGTPMRYADACAGSAGGDPISRVVREALRARAEPCPTAADLLECY